MPLILPHNNPACPAPEWLTFLVQSIPALLGNLLHQAGSPSLERMQFIGFNLSLRPFDQLKDMNPSIRDVKIHKTSVQQLTLSGQLMNGNEVMLDIALDYFMRGQRQYYKHPALPDLDTVATLPGIAKEDISAFLKAINRPCDFFIDEDLAHLNGHRSLFVPGIMILATLIQRALMENPLATTFVASFSQMLPENIPIMLATTKNPTAMLGLIAQNGAPIAAIRYT